MNIELQYLELLRDILENGVEKNTRNGKTLSVFGRTIRHDMKTGFPLLTSKKMAWRQIVTELLWFLSGNTNIKYLVDNDCHIWDGDALKNFNKHIDEENNRHSLEDPLSMYQPKARWSQEEFINKIKTDDVFAKKWGELGPVYGHGWRKWNDNIDQITNLIQNLKTNPDSRRLMVSAWNPSDLPNQVLPPCFTSDMIVKCIDGYRKISEITTNDLVLTEDFSYQKVYELHETKYNGDLLKIRTYGNSKSIKVTPNHPFLVKDKGYITASEITLNDYLAIPINKNEIIPSFKTILKDNQHSEKEIETILNDGDYWYLMGYYLGDGWLIDSKKEIYFTINDNQVDEILPRLKKIVGLAKLNNSGINCKKYVGKKQQLFEILSMFGKYAYGKKIPEFIYDAPKHLIREFLNGYKRADGCDTLDGISFTTISENIAYGLQLLYTKLGVKASVYHQKRPEKAIILNRIVNQKDTYSINISKQINKVNSYDIDDDYFWLKIKDIENVKYDGYVYNISTENNHTYNVFNLINHNCHYGFQVYTRELRLPERMELWEKLPNKDVMDFPIGDLSDEQYHVVLTQIGVPERSISLMYNTRSQDVPLGTPFNIASYALLLEIFGKMVNMVPDELISNMGDCHIYLNQVDGIKEQLTRIPFDLPKLNIDDSVNFGGSIDDLLTSCTNSNFKVVDYKSHSTIKMPLSN